MFFRNAERNLHLRSLLITGKTLIEKYPIYSIEDGLDEEDWEGWQIMTKELGGQSTACR